ncbi:ABC transporter permease subunit [Sinorhizobium medicae]|uniref:Binding-protein-dependent transport systems inner membrane component n=1 Tax=Sinorhizobium medicae (strain WSM419) TaxID=366394 RepID=A6UKX6_SINMW|nr:ABC transporter permease [Sinorhizobium medicae]ABR64306.1 binding-protein-dependent transport systems inner membrane component [Sinorhizobium medicae WSM419]MDX0437910.1 ABC transporter permease subunit [Sinorhizobium medicae]MDX0455990.1 ABC transporter permease subunit [Sinorhizobium medicae]MDX0468428.1 ABC transporter permease subunit [Sinorhizobium medicae]MDX0480904.1 ABC transporter permease subunit [Sinorhizobium medicae]
MSINTQSVFVMETGPAVSPLNSGGKVVTLEAAGQWTLICKRFLRHKIAAFAAGIILVLYLIGAFAEFLAPGLPNASRPQYTFAPPQRISLFTHTDNAGTRFLPHVKGYRIEIEPKALRRSFVVDEAKIIPIGFFVKGAPYKLWGVIPMETHLVGPLDAREPMYLLGSDRLGRDLMSRLIYGTRVSMSIGLVGVAISLTLGVVMGAVSGYYGGWVDTLIQRVIEIVSAMPTIPLWLGLAAAIPLSWSPLSVYFMVTLIVSLLSWTGLAREVRGRFFALRGDDFVTAARLDGAGERRIIFRHILPSLTSHILAVVTLAIPTMIVAETSLSFLGVGLKPPVVSWGVLLQDAQNVRTVATAPWLLIWPSLAVVLAVLSFNFFGDGLRDAADPYDT